MTLDFLTEVAESMNTTGHIGTAERIRCLSYIRPWIKKLSLFANATSQLYERSGARLRDCIRTLAQLSICYPEVRFEAALFGKHTNGTPRLDHSFINAFGTKLLNLTTSSSMWFLMN